MLSDLARRLESHTDRHKQSLESMARQNLNHEKWNYGKIPLIVYYLLISDLHSQLDQMHGPFAPTTVTPNLDDECGATKQKHPLQLVFVESHTVLPSAHSSAVVPTTSDKTIPKKFLIYA